MITLHEVADLSLAWGWGCRGMPSSSAAADCMRDSPPRTRPSCCKPLRWHLSHSESLLCERSVQGESTADSRVGLLVFGLTFSDPWLG